MKINHFSFLIAFLLINLLFISCSEEDNAENNILGLWTTTEFQAGILVDGVPVIRWYMVKFSATEAEASDFANTFIEELEDNLKGTMQLDKNGTYKINFGDEPEETGTWLLVEDNTRLSFTNSDNNESNESEIKTLTSSTLILGFTDTSRGDIDQDRINEDLFISIELTLRK